MVLFDLAAVLADSSISAVSRLLEAVEHMTMVVRIHSEIHRPDHPTRVHSARVLQAMRRRLEKVASSPMHAVREQVDFMTLSQRICVSQLIVYIYGSRERVSPEKARLEDRLQEAVSKEREAMAALAQIQREIAELRSELDVVDKQQQQERQSQQPFEQWY